MQARFYANMRTVINISSLEINDAHVDSFRKLVTFLVERYPEFKFHLLDDRGDLRPDLPVCGRAESAPDERRD